MEKFAFIFHPLTLEDMEHLSPIMKYIPDSVLEACLKMKKPFKVSHITGIKSPYAEAEGWFVGCPLTAFASSIALRICKASFPLISITYQPKARYLAAVSSFITSFVSVDNCISLES